VDDPVSRIPFSRDEEHTISSMARWMRFMAVVGLVGGLLMVLLLVVAIGGYSVAAQLTTGSPGWTRLQTFVGAHAGIVYAALGAFLVAAAVGFWQNLVLYHAGDDFNLVASTDVADLDYLARGLDKLRIFFKIQVLVVVVTVAIAFVTAVIVASAMLRPA
jgi:hypothetical protein